MSMTMKKRRWMAALVALALAAAPGGMSPAARVNAEEAPQSSTEKVQLDTPTPTGWSSDYTMNWEGKNESVDEYGYAWWSLEVYKDEQFFWGMSYGDHYYENHWDADKQETVYSDTPVTQHNFRVADDIFESGTYKFRVRAKALYDDETYKDSEWSEWSESITYVRPAQELGVVAKPTWDAEKAGVCHFMPLEDSRVNFFIPPEDSMAVAHYMVYLYRQSSDGTFYLCNWSWVNGWDWNNNHSLDRVQDVDFSDDISRYGEGKYYVTVQAFSDDIDIIANGRESEPSEILDTTVNAEKLSGILNAAAGKSAVETAGLLKDSADISAIQQAMQTDDTFRGQMQELENRYAQEQGIEVKPPAVSEAAKEYVDPARVSILGAAFNGAQNQTLNLQMDMTPEEERVPVFSGYKKNVQMDIRLVSESAEIHDLTMPVSVTMPIPQGINAAQLVILHRRADGVTVPTSFHVNGDGTVTFTVTSFSTFVFAEQTSGNVPSEPVPSQPAPDSGQGGASEWFDSLNSQIAAAAPGAVVKVTKEQGIDVLTNDVMQMLVRRGDVALDMEYVYQGTDYHIFIPAGKAVDNDIPLYGPLYLSAYFSVGSTAVGSAGTYVVQKGDTLSKIAHDHHTTVARLAAANPQIKDVNRIVTGQVINID